MSHDDAIETVVPPPPVEAPVEPTEEPTPEPKVEHAGEPPPSSEEPSKSNSEFQGF